ncbi:hypothetical protein E2562_014715 [Oryza meyeriana var. granulata]|uniref:Uncharacterized protein n=1 Tax=Oryza meyeriana var. granulata TaxID=110450 RepID=A0A6G1BKA1_9ORYZ|nr:hypothetical protein E2562_014715 [Oryza meyeriana var. granulata]
MEDKGGVAGCKRSQAREIDGEASSARLEDWCGRRRCMSWESRASSGGVDGMRSSSVHSMTGRERQRAWSQAVRVVSDWAAASASAVARALERGSSGWAAWLGQADWALAREWAGNGPEGDRG